MSKNSAEARGKKYDSYKKSVYMDSNFLLHDAVIKTLSLTVLTIVFPLRLKFSKSLGSFCFVTKLN